MTEVIERLQRELEHSRKTEAAIQENEKRFRAIFDYTSIGLAQIDLEGRFIEVNRSFCALLGYSRKELLERSYLDVTHPDDRDADRHIRIQLLEGHLPFARVEKRYVRKDGGLAWVNLNLSAVRGGIGKLPYLLAAIENISERRTIQESLNRIAANLAQTGHMALSGSWRWDSRTGETLASEEVFQLFGLPSTRKTVQAEIFFERVHPEDLPELMRSLRQAIADGKPHQFEYRVLLPDGTQRLLFANGEVFSTNDSGRPRVLIGMVQDVSLRRKAEQALHESELRFRELYDNAVDGIFIANQDGVYTDANRSACGMLGYMHTELVGKRIVDLIPETDAARLADVKKYLQEKPEHAQVAEWELKRKDGTFVPVEISTRILQDGRWMAIVRDISERRRTQQELERYAAEVRDLYDKAPCGYHSLDRNGVFIQINETGLDWLGYARGELIGVKKITDLLTDESRKRFREHFPKFLHSGRMSDMEFDFVRKSGSILPVLMTATGIFDAQGHVVASRATMFDITRMLEARKKLRQAAAVFEHTSDAIIITNADRMIVAVNSAFTRITGYQPEEVIGKNPRILKSERQENAFYRALWNAIEEHGTWQGEIWDRKKSGETFPAWECITAVKDETGKVTDYISVFSDITTIKETEEKLIRLAYLDALTGLPNRLLYNDRLGHALAHARRYGIRAALLLLDLDRFKLVNDTLGHSAGDELLKAIAARLKEAVREEDTVARLGGDEFAIILPQLQNPADAALLAEKVVQQVSRPLQVAGHSLVVSASIGIGIYPDDADDAETLAKVADTAMYGAKSKGRNAYEFYRREMTAAATELLAIDRGLRSAIDRGEFILQYQPKIDLASGRIAGVEALIRWASPSQGLQTPERFIRVAEETSLIERIGDWVLDAVCTQIQKWRNNNIPPLRVAINVSARQLRKPGFVDDMRKKLAAYRPLDGFGIDLEITETALQTETGIAECLQELKSIGVAIAIDDFGTGFSSLNSLKHLPVDTLKIDRSFVHDIPGNPDGTAITSAIIAMGHSLGLNIIAEGVETPEQLQFVVDHGCDEAQGYLFFSPLSADECEEFLAKNQVESMLWRHAFEGKSRMDMQSRG